MYSHILGRFVLLVSNWNLQESFDQINETLNVKEVQFLRIQQELDERMAEMSVYNRIYQ